MGPSRPSVGSWRDLPMLGRPLIAAAVGLGIAGSLSAAASTSGDFKIELGRKLFFDERLSADGHVSCATCHQPQHAFTDGRAVAVGVFGRTGTRNAPTLLGAALSPTFFWDGRRDTLEAQIGDPFVSANEHGLRDHEALLTIIRQDPAYLETFRRAFGGKKGVAVTLPRVEEAVAAFVRTLSPAEDSAFDRFKRGDSGALSEAQKRGLTLFQGRAACTSCHFASPEHATFTDGAFHASLLPSPIAARLPALTSLVVATPASDRPALISQNAEVAALGRFIVTLDPSDIGKFRTPTLRNVALTGPYFHDGSTAVLGDAVVQEAYVRGGLARRRLILTPADAGDLVAFLESLNSESRSTIER